MFTGIITDIGEVVARDGGPAAPKHSEGGRFVIAARYPVDSIAIGASIACSGCCLTVTELRHAQ